MIDNIKLIIGVVFICCMIILTIFIIFGAITYFSNEAENDRMAHSIECRISGGVYQYENYNWICK